MDKIDRIEAALNIMATKLLSIDECEHIKETIAGLKKPLEITKENWVEYWNTEVFCKDESHTTAVKSILVGYCDGRCPILVSNDGNITLPYEKAYTTDPSEYLKGLK